MLPPEHRGPHYAGELLSPAGARSVTDYIQVPHTEVGQLLSPAGARVVTITFCLPLKHFASCCPPQGRELLRPQTARERRSSAVVAVPRRGAKCYGKNAKNTMRIFGIPTIFLYYLLYFCVSIRDIVGFPRCEPACNNLIYCYYNTRFAPNQPLLHILCHPVSKPSSFATGCKTQRHKL